MLMHLQTATVLDLWAAELSASGTPLQVQYWQQHQDTPAGRAVFEAVTQLQAPCSHLAQHACSHGSTLNAIDRLHAAVSQLWDCQQDGSSVYNAQRMAHLLSLLGQRVIVSCERLLSAPESGIVWERNSAAAQSDVAMALEALALWQAHVDQCMRDWDPRQRGVSTHEWRIDPFIDPHVAAVVARLLQIHSLLQLRSEILVLVLPEQHEAVKMAFEPLHAVACLQVCYTPSSDAFVAQT